MFGGFWKPPMNSQSRRSAKGVWEPGASTMFDTNWIDCQAVASGAIAVRCCLPPTSRRIDQSSMLPLVCFLRFLSGLRITGYARLAFFSKEVEIDRVKNNAALRHVQAHVGDVFPCKLTPA